MLHIPYEHVLDFATPKELLDQWHHQEVTWQQYEENYTAALKERDILRKRGIKQFDGACFLCTEETPEQCHRRLLVEYMQKHSTEEVRIVHLM